MKQRAYTACGFIAIALGLIGLALPIIPTVPFVLLASWCFARGSQRFHHWLRNDKRFGKAIRDWESQGAINLKAKILATVMTVGGVSGSLIMLEAETLYVVVVLSVIALVLVYIWSRPLPKKS